MRRRFCTIYRLVGLLLLLLFFFFPFFAAPNGLSFSGGSGGSGAICCAAICATEQAVSLSKHTLNGRENVRHQATQWQIRRPGAIWHLILLLHSSFNWFAALLTLSASLAALAPATARLPLTVEHYWWWWSVHQQQMDRLLQFRRLLIVVG